MIGDLEDIVSRLRAVLPKRWFPDQSPNLTAILQSIATPWVWLYGMISYVKAQTRIGSATDSWLELISHDFFGDKLRRKANESDQTYRTRVKSALLRDAATRHAVSSGVEDLVGSQPVIFEPANCMDTGGYGSGASQSAFPGRGFAYCEAGGWGNLNLPLQFFVSTVRPPTPGIGMIAGYNTPAGAYCQGNMSYIDLALLPGHVTDQDIRTTLCSLLPVNAIAWLRIA
jgi:hypothetical protein